MLAPKTVFNQIQRLTPELISTGLCDDQNFPRLIPFRDGSDVVSIGKIDTTSFLKNIPYEEMYTILKEHRIYNFRMLDGALILLQYCFQNKQLITHRLSFFPSPDLQEFQNNPSLYMDDEIYADILDRRIVAVPMRFDFDNQCGVPIPREHPISHLTIGQYKNCRIPVASAITPYHFLSFILFNFYHTAMLRYEDKISSFDDCFHRNIFAEDMSGIYMNSPSV